MADRVETLGVDLRNNVKKLGVEEKARRKVGVKKYGTSKSVEGAGSGDGTYRKIRTEKANGGSSG